MSLVDVRSGEGRPLLGTMLILFGLIMAHTMMETARDAMFLSHVPASRLPLAYLGIGAGALVLGRLPRALGSRLGLRHAMLATLLIGAVASASFWLTYMRGHKLLFLIQYVWTGIFGTTAVTVFWLAVGDLFTLSQGKRIFGPISIGGGLGAITGAVVAALCASRWSIEHALLLAAAVQALSSVAVLLLPRQLASQPTGTSPSSLSLVSSLRSARQSRDRRYLLALAGLVVPASFTQMLLEYRFKAVMAVVVPAAWLGTLFGVYYAVLGVLALLFQTFSGPVIKRIGVTPVINVLPALLVAGGAGLLLMGGAGLTLILKTVDGSLRPSLHKTGMELLYLPLSSEVRSRVKPLLEGLFARGGQAMAALLLTALAALHFSGTAAHVALLLSSAAWLALALRMRGPYLDLLRGALGGGSIDTRQALPPLDLNSLEAVVAALNSPDDTVVITALDLLAAQGKQRLVPVVLLYHPSPKVIIRALEVLHQAERSDLPAHVERLLLHPAAEVRAAVLRLPLAARLSTEQVRALQADPSPVVRALLAAARGDRTLLAEMAAGPLEVRAALLSVTDDMDLALLAADSADPIVVRAASLAAERSGDLRILPLLISRLSVRVARPQVRQALLHFGDSGLAALEAALSDLALDPIVRRHIPRTISQFRTPAAVALLVRLLADESDGVVRFKALRGLGRLVADNPQLRPDRRTIVRITLDTARKLQTYHAWQALLRSHQQADARLATDSGQLLRDLLEDKVRLGLERLFRLLAILYPRERLIDVYTGITSADRGARALAFEMLENLLSPALREWVLPLVDELDERARLGRIAYRLGALPESYAELLQQMHTAGDEILTLIVTRHAAELGPQRSTASTARRRAPQAGMLRAAVAAAFTSSLVLGWGPALGAESRGAPDIRQGERPDGLPRRGSVKKALLAVPRAVLAIPRYTFWALSWPMRGLLEVNQRYHLAERAIRLSTSADGLIGVRPTIDYSLDFAPTFGLSFFDERAFGPQTSLRASAATFGKDVIVARAHARPLRAGQPVSLDLDVQYLRRNDQLFAGIGMSTPTLFARYAIDQVDVRADLSYTSVPKLTLRVFGQYGLRQFGDGTSYRGDPPISEAYCRRAANHECLPGTVDEQRVPGFSQGTQFIRYGASLHTDLRRHLYASGAIIDLAGDVTPRALDTQPTYFRAQAGLGVAISLWRRRALYLRSAMQAAAQLGDQPIPFSELPTLGGPDDLRGFIIGRFRDYATLLFSAEYRWPVWAWVDGTLFADYGGVFGKGFAGLSAGALRPDIGIGVRAQSRSKFIVRVQMAYGFGDGGGFRLIISGTGGT